MNRKDKRDRKKKRELKRRKERASVLRRKSGSGWSETIRRAQKSLASGDLGAAREQLEAYDAVHPGQPDVLRLLLDVYHQQRDYEPYCHAGRRLLETGSGNPMLFLMLASACLNAARPASALQNFRRFVELMPRDPLAEGARNNIAELEVVLEEFLRDAPFAPAEKFELAAMHEEVMSCLNVGDNARTIRVGETLLARCPEFTPASNNLSEAYFRVGRIAEALELSRQVLARDPENVHALANLARHLFLSGSQDEAREIARRLKAVDSALPDAANKKAETFSFLGDDEAVLDAFASAKSAGHLKPKTPAEAMFYHLAAVATCRRGDVRGAKRLWLEALAIVPHLSLAEENLDDLSRPVEERHGPWPFSMNYWISKETIERFMSALRPPGGKGGDAVERAAREFAVEHPALVKLVPALLDRGDEAGREFACRLAKLVKTPDALAALRDFCFSQRGSDALRVDAANFLSQAEVLPSGPARMWLKGDWRDIELCGFAIVRAPTGDPFDDPQVEVLAVQGMQAIRRQDGPAAERILKKALAIDPDSPMLLNNLAMAYLIQDKHEQSRRLIEDVFARFPDYFFGRVGMAKLAACDGDFKRAEEYLTPLRRKRELHVTEFAALAGAYFQLYLLQKKLEAAANWLEMWRSVDPDEPQLLNLELRLRAAKSRSSLAKWFTRGSRS